MQALQTIFNLKTYFNLSTVFFLLIHSVIDGTVKGEAKRTSIIKLFIISCPVKTLFNSISDAAYIILFWCKYHDVLQKYP